MRIFLLTESKKAGRVGNMKNSKDFITVSVRFPTPMWEKISNLAASNKTKGKEDDSIPKWVIEASEQRIERES